MKSEEDIERVIMNYFKDIFTSLNIMFPNHVLDLVDSFIALDMVALLQEAFIKGEVLESLHQIYPTKASSPDGMPPLFYDKFWHIVHFDVMHSILAILNNNLDPSFLNNTHIVLIPKTNNLKGTQDFRPICLYNVIF